MSNTATYDVASLSRIGDSSQILKDLRIEARKNCKTIDEVVEFIRVESEIRFFMEFTLKVCKGA